MHLPFQEEQGYGNWAQYPEPSNVITRPGVRQQLSVFSFKGILREERSILLNDEVIPLYQIMTRKTKTLIYSIVNGVIAVCTRYHVSQSICSKVGVKITRI